MATAESPASPNRQAKVRAIFDRFDANADGGLNRAEMAALVAAVNPSVHFTDDQISAILDEVFRTYSDFVPRPSLGLSFPGLLRTYLDGAGDVDRDFLALSLFLPHDRSPPSPPAASAVTQLSGFEFPSTAAILDDLRILIRRQIRAVSNRKKMESENGWSTELGAELDGKAVPLDSNSGDFKFFLREIEVIRNRANSAPTQDARCEAHIAVGRILYDHHLVDESLQSFRAAAKIKPSDVRAHFRMGNALCSLSRFSDAEDCYRLALEAAELDLERWVSVIPQIHVNMGIALEGEGLLHNACEHYREAAILCPTHYRALKHLGSALFGMGEYASAEKALEEAVLLKPDYADAHCDLGSVLHAVGEQEPAILRFQRVIDLKPDHLDALYNLGGLLMDAGRFRRAAEMYGRVLVIRPDHWRAQLNRAISLLGAGEGEESQKALRDALRMTNRVEIYDAIAHVKQLQRKSKGKLHSLLRMETGFDLDKSGNAIVVEASKFERVSQQGTAREAMINALSIRAFQKGTKWDRCDANLLLEGMRSCELPASSFSGRRGLEKSIRKPELEVVLRKLLQFLKPEAFQGSVKAIDERILSILDVTGSDRIDLGMFYAVVAPICAGLPDKRKRAAFDALIWRSMNDTTGQIRRADASVYLRYLRVIYYPNRGLTDLMDGGEQDDNSMISYPEFVEMFDDDAWGFGILGTLVKLENGDKIRHGGQCCDVCRYPVIGPKFKEKKCKFNLCAVCYSEGKVPKLYSKQEQYRFHEYWS